MENTIVKSIELSAPISLVWRAVSDHVEFSKWFQVKVYEPFVVGETSHGHITYPGFEYVKWESVITAMQPEQLFSYTWHPNAVDADVDYSNEAPTVVEFRLEAISGGTRLTVTESGFESIPSDRRSEAYRMNLYGWTVQTSNIRKYLSAQFEATASS